MKRLLHSVFPNTSLSSSSSSAAPGVSVSLQPWAVLLEPWLAALVHHMRTTNAASDAHDVSLRPRAHHLEVEPLGDLMLKFDGTLTPDGVHRLIMRSCALEIIALALRVEPRVWSLLRSAFEGALINMAVIRDDDLGAGIAIEWRGVHCVYPAYAPLFHVAGEADSATLSANPHVRSVVERYNDTKRQLVKMDTQQRLRDYQIPLTLRFCSSGDALPFRQLHAVLQAMTQTGNVATSAATSGGGGESSPRATYRLVDVHVDGARGTREELAAIEALGVHLTTCSNDGVDNSANLETLETLLEPKPQKPSVALTITSCMTSELSVPALYTVLLRGGQQLDALAIKMDCERERVDYELLARVLLHTRNQCVGLRRLEIAWSDTLERDEALSDLENALAIVRHGRHHRRARLLKTINAALVQGTVVPLLERSSWAPQPHTAFVIGPNGRLHVVDLADVEVFDEEQSEDSPVQRHTSRLESVVVRSNRLSQASANRLVTLLTQSLSPRLLALTLNVATLDADCVRLILESFPHLHKLSMAAMPDVTPLLDAYRNGTCAIQSLRVDAPASSALALLEELADPTTRAATRLRELVLVQPGQDQIAFATSMERMLEANHVLEYVKITRTSGEVRRRLSGLCEQKRVVGGASVRVRAAFASVVAASQVTKSPLGALNTTAIELIFAFGAPFQTRIIELEP